MRSIRQPVELRQRISSSKTFFVVLAQGILLLVLYSWMTQEYQANAKMQAWLGANVSIGNVLFANASLLVVSAVVMLVVFESIPGKLLAR